MLKNYLIIAIRNLLKHKMYAMINVLGLAFALALCLTALSYVIYEFSWEDFHINKDRVYRVEATYTHVDTVQGYARVMPALGQALIREVPGVENAAVFSHDNRVTINIDKKRYKVEALIWAQPEFFDVFSVDLEVGDQTASLSEPYTTLISASAAEQYFPKLDPIGHTVEFNDQTIYQITGVFKDMPENTQLKSDFIASYSTLALTGVNPESWEKDGFSALTYLLLRDGADPEAVAAKIHPIVSRHLPAEVAARYSFRLKPLKEIYFETYYSGNLGEIWPGIEWDMLYILVGLALFILIQAIANFINLSTARSTDRVKEVGVRKTFGAGRRQLIKQFLGESIIITGMAMLIGVSLFEFFKRGLESTLLRQMTVDLYSEPLMLFSCIALVIVVGVLAGAYPALYMSRFRPIAVFQSQTAARSSRSLLRKGLVVFQFTLAIIFILSTVILYRQLSFVTGIDLGLNQKNVLVLRFAGDGAADKCRLMKNEILANNTVVDAASSNHALGSRNRGTWRYYLNAERKDEDRIVVKSYAFDCDAPSFYDLKVIRGRGFSADHPEDINHGILISKSMAEGLAIVNPIGYRLFTEESIREVVGVVEDFHGTTLRMGYGSWNVLELAPEKCNILTVRLPSGDLPESVAGIRETWQETFPDVEFNYTFLSQDIRGDYSELDDMISFFGVLALVSIGIACLGIFGLVSFTAAQKTKEIGIRKVLGASVAKIVSMLSKEYIILIVIANAIASPLAYLWLSPYLQEFPFRISLGIGTFAAGGFFALIIALGAAGCQSVRAALANPVESLRHE